MPSRKEILLDSVRKLLSLEGVSEKDIIGNLKGVGISEREAKNLIEEAKGKKLKEKVEWKRAEKHFRKPIVEESQETGEEAGSEEETAEETAGEEPVEEELE